MSPIKNIKNTIKYSTTIQESYVKFLVISVACIIFKRVVFNKTIIWPVVLYGCKTWSLTLTDERRLRVFENWVLRRIFGPKRNEVTGEWRKLHNEELKNQYSSPNIARVIKSRMRWAVHVALMEEGSDVYRVWVGKPEGKRRLERPSRG